MSAADPQRRARARKVLFLGCLALCLALLPVLSVSVAARSSSQPKGVVLQERPDQVEEVARGGTRMASGLDGGEAGVPEWSIKIYRKPKVGVCLGLDIPKGAGEACFGSPGGGEVTYASERFPGLGFSAFYGLVSEDAEGVTIQLGDGSAVEARLHAPPTAPDGTEVFIAVLDRDVAAKSITARDARGEVLATTSIPDRATSLRLPPDPP
jgi:hypothetical protein